MCMQQQYDIYSHFLPPTYAGHVGLVAAGLGDACQSDKMATLLNSLFFVFNISLQPTLSNVMLIL